MKKLFLILLVAVLFACSKDDCTQEALSELVNGLASRGNITICHITEEGNSQTISINSASLQTHLNHGDTEGACPTLNSGGLKFSNGKIVDIDCSYELPFLHIKDNGETWYFSKPN